MACARCEDLEERIRWLESELHGRPNAERLHRITQALPKRQFNAGGRPQTARLVDLLYAAPGALSHQRLLDTVGGPKGEDRDMKIVQVWVCRARKVLGADAIENVYGYGYRMTDVGRAWVDRIFTP